MATFFHMQEVAQSDLVLMPVHQGSHWALLAYFIRRKAVLLMDSLVANGHINRQTAMVRAKSFLTFFLQPEDLKWDEWSFSMPDDIPQQSNSDDCGVYACQACIPRLRQWMVLELSEDQEMMRYRPDRGSDRPNAEGDPTRGRAGTEGDAEYTMLYFIHVILTRENRYFNEK
ncbi:SUMO1 sentrin specific peptidase 1 [Branchiostoma belcheri]|nr:SUMO1 sentrin specific peptidase 1 [Branchiostoma belcheri]